MKIYQVKKEDRNILSMLDPFDRLAILDNPCGFALACMTDEGEASAFAGLLVGTATDSLITIDWMAVDPSRQGLGIGESLLLTVYDMADAAKIEDICAVVCDEYEYESFSKGAQSFFDERLFEESKKGFGDVIISLSELAKLPYFSQDRKKYPAPEALSSFTTAEQNNILTQLCANSKTSQLLVPGRMKDVIEPELSFVFMDEGEPFEGFIVQRAGDYLMPVYYFAEDDRDGTALILSSFEKAVSKYKTGDVMILQREKKIYELLSDIMPEMDRSTMLWAKLSDYRNAI